MPGRWLITGAAGFLGRHLLTHADTEPTFPGLLALVRSRRAWDEQDWTGDFRRVEVVS